MKRFLNTSIALLLLAFWLLLLKSLTLRKDDMVLTLELMGLSNVQLTGQRLKVCNVWDISAIGFTATKNGKLVAGVICAGFLDGYTVEFSR